MPDMKEMYEKALKDRAKILKELEPLRKKEKELMEKFQPIDEELRAVRQDIADLEKKRKLKEVGKTIHALAPTQHHRLLAEEGKMEVTHG